MAHKGFRQREDNKMRQKIAEIIKSGQIGNLSSLGITYEGKLRHKNKENLVINCLAYTLNLHESDVYEDRCYELGADINFFVHVLEKLSETKLPIIGDIVVYFKEANYPTHAGKIIDIDPIIIRSSWGNLGLFTHDLWSVEPNYGNIVRFYKPIDLQDVEKLYEEKWKEKFSWLQKCISK